jgi:hypothetical protein
MPLLYTCDNCGTPLNNRRGLVTMCIAQGFTITAGENRFYCDQNCLIAHFERARKHGINNVEAPHPGATVAP